MGKLYFSSIWLIWPDLTMLVCQIILGLNTNAASHKSTSTDPIYSMSSHTQIQTRRQIYTNIGSQWSGMQVWHKQGAISRDVLRNHGIRVWDWKKKPTDMLFLVWTGRHANGDIQKVQSSLSSKAKCMRRRRKQKRREKERSGGFVWKSPYLYHQSGTIKKQRRRREGRGNGVVMNVVPQLPSFRVFIFHFY